jgi:hypothetical protein
MSMLHTHVADHATAQETWAYGTGCSLQYVQGARSAVQAHDSPSRYLSGLLRASVKGAPKRATQRRRQGLSATEQLAKEASVIGVGDALD